MIPNGITEQLSRDDRAVSPVIGVILMVAITVILAAVIGTFVLDLGQSAGNAAPSASLTVTANTNTGNLTIAHRGGDGLNSEQTRIIVSNETREVTFEPESDGDGSVLTVGNEAIVNLSTGANAVDWNNDGTHDVTGSNEFDGIVSGSQYTVELIDTESQRVIYDTTVTA